MSSGWSETVELIKKCGGEGLDLDKKQFVQGDLIALARAFSKFIVDLEGKLADLPGEDVQKREDVLRKQFLFEQKLLQQELFKQR